MHEQSRPDRDQYITINWENMNSAYQSQFSVCNNCDVQDTEYDYSSVMHYPSNAFSTNPQLDTIVRNDGEDLVSRVYDLGLGLSCLDIVEINKQYTCGNVLLHLHKSTKRVLRPPISLILMTNFSFRHESC